LKKRYQKTPGRALFGFLGIGLDAAGADLGLFAVDLFGLQVDF
jgi:hypothetical protein